MLDCLLPPSKIKVMFSLLLVGLFVCLLRLRRLLRKPWSYFHETWWVKLNEAWAKDTSIRFWDGSGPDLDLFLILSKGCVYGQVFQFFQDNFIYFLKFLLLLLLF